ncbi:UbiA-like protein EboC [Autumnicola psychrophila]|uniref:UbiA-like protein EboC n=1 Tax=Autumnicola psychrophila TaxID=3075592 RepID=A0ABU3DMM7_9FLAO|nr:UbiA-like protein EboC [Zunongwangia sp. F225]MDT0684969.1 UbiA-like protein EboC [Zunongwangia sp. F225]
MKIIIAHLQLMRPANIITAVADILAGFAVSGAALQLFSAEVGTDPTLINTLLWLILATIGLYGGGIVFNDVFDADLDRKERPERPIPSGRASVQSASILACILFLIGLVSAWQISVLSAVIALAVAILAVLYNAWGKHQLVFGPVNMGLCRGGNLLLGMSAIPAALQEMWFISIIPVIYIAAITMISRGEVHGGNRKAIVGGAVMYAIIILAIIGLAFLSEILWWQVLPFVLLFSFLIFRPLIQALQKQEPRLIGKAVKAGVLSLIVLNASLATVFAGWVYGLIVLLLLPVSLLIAKKFSVT